MALPHSALRLLLLPRRPPPQLVVTRNAVRPARSTLRVTSSHLSPLLVTPPPTSLSSSPLAALRLSGCARQYSSAVEAPDYLSEGERAVFEKLKDALQPERLEVQDISGGCGSMYGLDIISSKFTGLSVVKQHKMVNEILKQEIASWHGVQLKTKAP